MAGFTTMHHGQKLFQKANRRFLKEMHEEGSYFLCFVKVLTLGVFLDIFSSCFCVTPTVHSGKMHMLPGIYTFIGNGGIACAMTMFS